MHIIGIELIDGEKDVIKNLCKKDNNNNGWFSFVGYEGREKPPIPGSTIAFSVDSSFYRLDDISDIEITISCIVGKNGSGKSTLLDLLYRILNNVAYYYQAATGYGGCEIEYAHGFNTNLYFEVDNQVNVIKIDAMKGNSQEDTIFYDGSEINISNFIKNNGLSSLSQFFYTVVTNYSAYSFNPEDYVINGKDNYYLNGIFHKNDGYITPIVLLPFRDGRGIIDIENERTLAKQRIISLIIYLYNVKGTLLVENRKPTNIVYKLKGDIEVLRAAYDDDAKANIKDIISNNNDIFERLKDAWRKSLGIDGLDDKLKKLALSYLIYKTIKICKNYKLFKEELSDILSEEKAIEIIEEIRKNKSHMTLKIRQCIEFIKSPLDQEGIINISEVLPDEEKSLDALFLKLPPSFYNCDLRFKGKDKKSGTFLLSKMSSGELQLLNSFSYVLYHLNNLDSDKKDTNKNSDINYPSYNNVTIVFDEAELYLHPEYQRIYVYIFLNAIKACSFKRVKKIHVIIATHSPYLLSDVVADNVLHLDNGSAVKMQHEETFCANIYDILEHQFFLESAVGKFAEEKIRNLLEQSESSSVKPLSKDVYEYYQKFINKIGDKYLKKSLECILKKYEESNDSDISWRF